MEAPDAPVELTGHARQRMTERGATRPQVEATIQQSGEGEEARHGRRRFRRTFPFDDEWNGTHYEEKEVEALAVWEDGRWVVITVIVRYFN